MKKFLIIGFILVALGIGYTYTKSSSCSAMNTTTYTVPNDQVNKILKGAGIGSKCVSVADSKEILKKLNEGKGKVGYGYNITKETDLSAYPNLKLSEPFMTVKLVFIKQKTTKDLAAAGYMDAKGLELLKANFPKAVEFVEFKSLKELNEALKAGKIQLAAVWDLSKIDNEQTVVVPQKPMSLQLCFAVNTKKVDINNFNKAIVMSALENAPKPAEPKQPEANKKK